MELVYFFWKLFFMNIDTSRNRINYPELFIFIQNPRMHRGFTFLFLLFIIKLYAQKVDQPIFDYSLNRFSGTILEHNPDIAHLITDHPKGWMFSINRKTFGQREWEKLYNYPDYGVSFIFQNMKNYHLGENYSIYGHFNFYFFKRLLQFRVGQGIAIASKPYDRNSNFINNAYGSRLLSSTYLKFNLKRNNIWRRFGIEAGVSIIHYSNASSKAPNNSTNTFAFNAGVNYLFSNEKSFEYIPKSENNSLNEKIKYNLAFRVGINETDVINSGQFPFFTVSGFASKRIHKKSALQLGVDLFFATFLKEYLQYQSIAFPERGLDGTEDWKRIGILAGHELYFGKLTLITQLGYYIYYPFEYQGKWYNRIGLNYYIKANFFTSITVKSHGATAEGVEFGTGFKF